MRHRRLRFWHQPEPEPRDVFRHGIPDEFVADQGGTSQSRLAALLGAFWPELGLFAAIWGTVFPLRPTFLHPTVAARCTISFSASVQAKKDLLTAETSDAA